MSYSQKMRVYRFENNLKQSDVAQRLGISQQVYSLIESEQQKPKIDFILLYKKITGIDLASDIKEASKALHKKIDGNRGSFPNSLDLAKEIRKTIKRLERELKSLQKRVSAVEKKIDK